MTQSGWFYHASKTVLYHSTPQGVRHSMVPRQSRAQAFHRHGKLEDNYPLWETTQIATIRIQGDKIIMTGAGQKKLAI